MRKEHVARAQNQGARLCSSLWQAFNHYEWALSMCQRLQIKSKIVAAFFLQRHNKILFSKVVEKRFLYYS